MGAPLLTEIWMNNMLSLAAVWLSGKRKTLSVVAKMNWPSTSASVSLRSQTRGVKDTEMWDSNFMT